MLVTESLLLFSSVNMTMSIKWRLVTHLDRRGNIQFEDCQTGGQENTTMVLHKNKAILDVYKRQLLT